MRSHLGVLVGRQNHKGPKIREFSLLLGKKEGQIWKVAELQRWISSSMKFLLWSVHLVAFTEMLVFIRKLGTNICQTENNVTNVKRCGFSMLHKTTQ